MIRPCQLTSSGKYIPKNKVSAEDVDTLMGNTAGTAFASSNIQTRYYADNKDETCISMGAFALKEALEKANLELNDLDAVICASGTSYQEIPFNASLILKFYETHYSYTCKNITSFDVNSTCLSFVTGLDVVSSMMNSGRFKKVAIISTEVASIGINYSQIQSAPLFGDGAVAFIVEPTTEDKGVMHCEFQTFPEGAEYCELEGGGSKIPAADIYDTEVSRLLFNMDGRKVFTLAYREIDSFFDTFYKKSKLTFNDIDFFIPHQASYKSMKIIFNKLKIPEDKYLSLIEDYGNMISVSIPLGLHLAIENKQVKKGDKVMLIGTSAGFCLGALVIQI